MTPPQFVEKWSRIDLPERAASQEHFIDLCHMLGQRTPAGHDATGAEYAFEKGVDVAAGASAGAKGDRGFADVWWRGKFALEYKRKGKYRGLNDAYRQLHRIELRELTDPAALNRWAAVCAEAGAAQVLPSDHAVPATRADVERPALANPAAAEPRSACRGRGGGRARE